MYCYGRFITFALFLFFLPVSASCDEPAFRVRIESGGIVPFHINSMRKYNDGQVLAEWTILSFHIENYPEAIEWEVELSTSGNLFQGDYGNTLATEGLIVKAHEIIPSDPGLFFPQFTDLGSTPQTLVQGTGNGTFFITVTYELGTQEEHTLLGENPDYYFSELYYVLKIIN